MSDAIRKERRQKRGLYGTNFSRNLLIRYFLGHQLGFKLTVVFQNCCESFISNCLNNLIFSCQHFRNTTRL